MEKSNTYIFIYSVAMVVIIATLLSVAAFSLKPAQQANVKIEKMQNIFSVHRSEKTPGSKYSSTSGLSPRGHLERQAEFHASTQDEA